MNLKLQSNHLGWLAGGSLWGSGIFRGNGSNTALWVHFHHSVGMCVSSFSLFASSLESLEFHTNCGVYMCVGMLPFSLLLGGAELRIKAHIYPLQLYSFLRRLSLCLHGSLDMTYAIIPNLEMSIANVTLCPFFK